MKDLVNERLKLLATAQESMTEVADTMDQWENSQLVLEKRTFDSINISDKALNLSKEGYKMISKLQDSCINVSKNPEKSDIKALGMLLEEAEDIVHNILDATKSANEIAHNLELEVAYQREIAERMKNSIGVIGKSVDQAVACAEFLLTEL